MKKIILSLMFVMVGCAQTTTTYVLPEIVCSNLENCNYEIANSDHSGLFQATTGYNMQFQYRAFPGQNPGYQAEYCNALGTWSAAATPDLGSTASLFTMDCDSHNLQNSPSHMHAEIYAHSYEVTYICGGRVRTTCHATRWQIDANSTLIITK